MKQPLTCASCENENTHAQATVPSRRHYSWSKASDEVPFCTTIGCRCHKDPKAQALLGLVLSHYTQYERLAADIHEGLCAFPPAALRLWGRWQKIETKKSPR